MEPAETPLEAAARAAVAAPEDAAAQRLLHARVLDAELHLLLAAEAEDDRLRPRVFELDAGPVVVAFDTAARLAAFLEVPAPYAALSGRRLATMLAEAGLGIALNPGLEGAETLLSVESVAWLSDVAAEVPERAEARPLEVAPPRAATPALIAALDARIATMAGRIDAAWLATLIFADGSARLAVAVAGAAEATHEPLAAALAEAARLADAPLDVTFLDGGARARAAFERAGLRFDPPPPPKPPAAPAAPGSDPSRPPILRARRGR